MITTITSVNTCSILKTFDLSVDSHKTSYYRTLITLSTAVLNSYSTDQTFRQLTTKVHPIKRQNSQNVIKLNQRAPYATNCHETLS